MNPRRPITSTLLALALSGSLAASAHAAATITIINNDAAGVGFNDPTPAAPVGGNPGVTIGQQRLNVFNQAASVWGSILTSSVTIPVRAQWAALSCNATSAVLGSAGPVTVSGNFAGAEILNHWYHPALANKLSGVDQSAANPDISATFNQNLGQAGCLTGRFFYYGFDGNEGANIDLLVVLLHELGHGLGFSTVTSGSSGNYISGFPAVWDHFLFDRTTGLHWDEMTPGQRVASAINTNNLVWDGYATTFETPYFMGPKPEVVVNSPGGIAGAYEAGTATFGAALTSGGLTGNVVLVDDGNTAGGTGTINDGCETPFVNAGAVAGKIALIDRGLCPFAQKALNAQNNGAIGVIVANNVAGPPQGMSGTDPSITIPVVSVSLADGNLIKANLGAGVNVTIHVNPSQFAGSDNLHRMRMYAPNPYVSGSSVSHFDVSATPNVLMEPNINADLSPSGVDMTRYLFEDIGWFLPRTTSAPNAPGEALALLASPNPSNGPMTVRFALRSAGAGELGVYDMAGRRVAQLLKGELQAGEQSVTWNGTDDAGLGVAPGVYMIRLRAPGVDQSKPVIRME